MVWKSNLSDTEQEIIEDLGGAGGAAVTGVNSQPPTAGGIQSNRKSVDTSARSKTAAVNQQSRY
jgi:hypothetical protein